MRKLISRLFEQYSIAVILVTNRRARDYFLLRATQKA